MRDTYSVASLFPKLRVEASRSQAFSGSRAWLLEASYVGQSHGKNAYDSYLPKAVSVLGCFLATYISWITDGSPQGPGRAITPQRDIRIPLVNTRSLCGGQGWRHGYIGGGRQSRGGSLAGPALRNYVAPARARWSNRNR